MPTLGSTFLQTYRAQPGSYDEMLDQAGKLRAHWRQFSRQVNALGGAELARRWDLAQAQLYEHGMAYGVYGEDDSPGGPRPWRLDPLPTLIPRDQWQEVSAGLCQRAELLNRILTDLYGPQELLTRGLLPPEIVFAHPGFQRSYHGYVPPGGRYLHCYAADLARSSTGRWWLLSDRTEAPSGMGHVLENRIVLSGMLSSVFHQCRIERLAPYFIALRETLTSLAPTHRDNPRIVLLSPGPSSASYFEDSYLARYLGYTLVLAGDLTVRQGRVMLKTLGGLLPVDVILRRTNSDSCDALELSEKGDGGPAGLLQAVRAGNVTVANSLGAGLVESPVFQAFMPRLCEKLLGEPLKIPNIATWWCGDPRSLQYVLEHWDQLLIRRAFRHRGDEMETNRRLDQTPAGELMEKVKAAPREYVAQERVSRSLAPVWSGGTLTPAHMALRAYLAASDDSYVVMQGALARTSPTPQPLDISVLAGEGSKDAWIVSDEPVSQVSLLRSPGSGIRLRRSGAELPSRVAEDLFWLGRYLERGDCHARLVRTLVDRLTDEASAEATPEMAALLRGLARQGQIEPGFAVDGIRDALPTIERALPSAVMDEAQEGSLRWTIKSLFRIASQVRDRLSLDSWRIVRRINRLLRTPPGGADVEIGDLPAELDRMIVSLAAFNGLVMESMTRSLAWRFLDLGRRLERAHQITGLVASLLEEQHDAGVQVLEALLEAADSSMTYRSRYLADLQVAAVLDLLLADETTPRSVAYQLAALVEHVESLPRDGAEPRLGEDQRLAATLHHDVRMANVTALAESYNLGNWQPLETLLEDIDGRLPRLSDAIYHRYLIHAGPSRQLSDFRPEFKL